jgi:hypothetical protein
MNQGQVRAGNFAENTSIDEIARVAVVVLGIRGSEMDTSEIVY